MKGKQLISGGGNKEVRNDKNSNQEKVIKRKTIISRRIRLREKLSRIKWLIVEENE